MIKTGKIKKSWCLSLNNEQTKQSTRLVIIAEETNYLLTEGMSFKCLLSELVVRCEHNGREKQ